MMTYEKHLVDVIWSYVIISYVDVAGTGPANI